MSILRVVGVAVVFFAVAAQARAQVNFNDGFEGATLSSFWVPQTDSGMFTLSNEHVFQGSQSLKLTTFDTPGVNKNVVLRHTFSELMHGTASISVLDLGADVFSSNYIFLNLSNSTLGTSKGIFATDYDLGPGQDGSTYLISPGDVSSNVDRTQAWHTFTFENSNASTVFKIDGNVVFTENSPFAFDGIQFGLSGPFWRPPFTTFYDQFSFSGSPVPEPSSLPAVAAGIGALFLCRRFAHRLPGFAGI